MVVDVDDRPVAIVNETAVTATPPERRPWVTAGEVSRRLDPALVLGWDMQGEDLLDAMAGNPATEYLVVDADGKPYGVLSSATSSGLRRHLSGRRVPGSPYAVGP